MEKLEVKSYNLCLNIKGSINIIGKPSSGKTNLFKRLINKIKDDSIYIDDKPINSYDIDFLRRNIAICEHNLNFSKEYVRDELLFYISKLGYNTDELLIVLNKLSKFFKIDELLEAKLEYLTYDEKVLVRILSLLIIKPKIFGIDNMLTYLKLEDKLRLFKYIKENNIFLLNITNNKEELLYCSHIMIIDNYKAKVIKKTKDIIFDEKVLAKAGMKPPFIIDLNIGLKYYGILEDNYNSLERLIDDIWK